MASLEHLKAALLESASSTTDYLPRQALSDTQYAAGFDALLSGAGRSAYELFIIPQLSTLLDSILQSQAEVSILEIGPGPKTVLGHLPTHLKLGIKRYVAFEPNKTFASTLEDWLLSNSGTGLPLPSLKEPPRIHVEPFTLESTCHDEPDLNEIRGDQKFDIILFCHSLYGMRPKRKFIDRALRKLTSGVDGGVVVLFHRDADLHLEGFVCQRRATFPTGTVSVLNEDDVLDHLTPFIAGFSTPEADSEDAVQIKWRKVCRAMSDQGKARQSHLFFSSPIVMMVFTPHAAALSELTAKVPLVPGNRVKNRVARRYQDTFVVRPKDLNQVQQCVRWSLKHHVSISIVGGGHSDHCLQPNVVSIDMGSFSSVEVLEAQTNEHRNSALIVAGAGCKTGDIIQKAMAAGLAVPLGSRPSVGAGLWLQGGIGHLARLQGLACDAIVGAVMVSVESGGVLLLGHVPSQYQPINAIRPKNEANLMWALKGAGTNFGIVINVTFKACAAMTYLVRQWVTPLGDRLEAQQRLADFNNTFASQLPDDTAADAYLYWHSNRLHVGISVLQSFVPGQDASLPTGTPSAMTTFLGPEDSSKSVDAIGLFDTEIYMSSMHGGHGGGKTSSFKRCIFFEAVGDFGVTDMLITAIENRPSPLCYLHLLHGGGAVSRVPADATAFGCRNWTFACVITGIWSRDEDGSPVARAVVNWVYDVAGKMLPFSTGAYSADLGPDPRDVKLAVKAFGSNRPRLAGLKRSQDPHNVLAYTCPLLIDPVAVQMLIVLVTGRSGAGKDHCAKEWAARITECTQGRIRAQVTSISDATKREYAVATGADMTRLLHDRAYKEEHRPALTRFFQDQLRQRPQLKEDNFLRLVYNTAAVDVLLITGMRDESPVAALSHLVPHAKLIEVRVTASKETRQARRGLSRDDEDARSIDEDNPTLIFNNEGTGNDAVKRFAEHSLLPFVQDGLRRLESMVR